MCSPTMIIGIRDIPLTPHVTPDPAAPPPMSSTIYINPFCQEFQNGDSD